MLIQGEPGGQNEADEAEYDAPGDFERPENAVAGPVVPPPRPGASHSSSPHQRGQLVRGEGRLGSARRPPKPSARRHRPVAGRPSQKERVSVYWPDLQEWFVGTVTTNRSGRSRVLYDATDEWPSHACWHDLFTDQWRYIDATGSAI